MLIKSIRLNFKAYSVNNSLGDWNLGIHSKILLFVVMVVNLKVIVAWFEKLIEPNFTIGLFLLIEAKTQAIIKVMGCLFDKELSNEQQQ